MWCIEFWHAGIKGENGREYGPISVKIKIKRWIISLMMVEACGLNQRKYREESQRDNMLVLAVYKPIWVVSAISSQYGLFLTALLKQPTFLLNKSDLWLLSASSLFEISKHLLIENPWLTKLNFSNSPLSSAVRKNHLEQISPDYGCVLRILLLSPRIHFSFDDFYAIAHSVVELLV